MIFKMSRQRAKELGLLTCANCGYPENNHFPWGSKPSAHDSSCKKYQEAPIRGIMTQHVGRYK